MIAAYITVRGKNFAKAKIDKGQILYGAGPTELGDEF